MKVNPPGAGRTQRRSGRPYLGGAGGRHAAGDRDDRRRRPRRAVPRHRQRRLVQPAAVRPVRGHAAPAGGTVGRGRQRAGQRHAGAGRDAGRVRPVVAAAARRDRPAGGQVRLHPGLPAPSARPVRAGKRPPGAEPGHQHRRSANRPRRSPARRWKPSADRPANARWVRRCWPSPSCCCASIC